MDQSWFEMRDVRKRPFSSLVWIPLRAIVRDEADVPPGTLGHREDFFGVGSLAVPISAKESAMQLGWSAIGIHSHAPYIDLDDYKPADIYSHPSGDWTGTYLVLEHQPCSTENRDWHLHPDFVIALGLKRENDVWLRPAEDYTEVARLQRESGGSPNLLCVRSEYLLDYLCARSMGLLLTSYRSRVEIGEDASHIRWDKTQQTEVSGHDRWEGYVTAIHEGGMPYGERLSIVHVARKDVDPNEDIPEFGWPADKDVSVDTTRRSFRGKKLFQIQGNFWRDEWIEPGEHSPRVRGDEMPPTAFFIADKKGTKESRDRLIDTNRWLWFRPTVMTALIDRRGGFLRWYTMNTGEVGCSPDYGVHFGVNKVGLINVFAKDIALLPDWQQTIWAGHNVSPDGGVSEELLESQMKATPADTQAPEGYLFASWLLVNKASVSALGGPLFRLHEHHAEIIKRVHRFRSTDQAGLFELAKDLARLSADSIEIKILQNKVAPPQGEKWGSLKSLEAVLAQFINPQDAHTTMGPLFGIYEMRLGDAHLPGEDISKAYELLEIDPDAIPVFQGYQLLHRFVSSLYQIASLLGQG